MLAWKNPDIINFPWKYIKSNKSILDTIDGIGAAKRKFLMKHFGSVNKIRQAPDSEIALLKGFSKKLAKKIKENI